MTTPLDDMPGKEIRRRAQTVRGDVVQRREHEEAASDEPSREDRERFSGVTVKCKHCGSELFDDAAVCWNCGKVVLGDADNTGIPKWAILLAVVLVGLIVLLIVLPGM